MKKYLKRSEQTKFIIYPLTTEKKDAESNQPGPHNSKYKSLRSKHASNTTIDRDQNQDDRFSPTEMSEVGQPYSPLRFTNEFLNETIMLKENRQEADYHTITLSSENPRNFFSIFLMINFASAQLRFETLSTIADFCFNYSPQ